MPADPPLPELDRFGRVDAPYVHLGDGFALPPDGMSIAVRNSGETLGWLTCTPQRPATGVAPDRRRAALALADHLGLVLALAQNDASAA